MKPRISKTPIFYGSLALVFIFSFVAPRCMEEGERGLVLAAVLLLFSIVNWILETVPIAVTSLTLIALIPFTGLLTFSDAVKGSFGNSIFAFFLGVLLLSSAFRNTDLGKLISGLVFRVFGRSPRAAVLGIMVTGAVLAMWVTEIAAAAIVFPIVVSVWEKAKGRADDAAIGKALMLGVAWGCAFGGVATPIATGANLIAINYLDSLCGIEIGFGTWMMIGVPICVTLILAGWVLLSLPLGGRDKLPSDGETPDFGPREKKLTAIFLLAILGWVFGEKVGISSHQVAIMASISLFLPGIEVLEWKSAIRNISWESIFLICAGVLMGDVLYSTGLAEMLARLFFIPGMLEQGVFIRDVYIVIAVSVLKILFSSNTVSGVVLVPIMISVAAANDLSAWGLVAPCIFSSALSLIVISSSPVNVIPYSAKTFTPKDMAVYGIGMTVLAALIIGVWLTVFGIV